MAQITLNSSGVASSGSLLLQTNGTTTQATLDTSGNLGLGVTPSANWTYKALQVGYAGSLSANTSNTTTALSSNTIFGSSNTYIQAGYATSFQQAAGEFRFYNAASGSAGGAISFTQAMTLDASGNLLLGTTTSNGFKFKVSDAGGAEFGFLPNDGGVNNLTNYNRSTASYVPIVINASDIRFSIAASEKARIDSSGNLLVGTTSQFGSGLVCFSADNSVKNPLAIKNTGTTYGAGYHLILFQNSSGTQCGAIDQTAVTTTNYNTSSDARLKEDSGIATDTSVVDNIVIHDFVWKADGRADRGVFAQEAFEVKPSAISVGKDDLTEDGNLAQPWGVDYSKFVPDLIVHAQQLKKQVQEQQALIASQSEIINAQQAALTQLQTDVAALKAK